MASVDLEIQSYLAMGFDAHNAALREKSIGRHVSLFALPLVYNERKAIRALMQTCANPI